MRFSSRELRALAETDSALRPPPVHRAASRLDDAIDAACAALGDSQRGDGHWVFELEADATIPAEYILLSHYLGDRDPGLEAKFATYLRRRQGGHGGWPLYFGGEFDLSASVKAYFALKAAGDAPDAPHMRRAREAILARGGAGESKVFTRILLALFGVVPWSCVPVLMVEAVFLPRWFPFHLTRISYWSRTVLVPLLVLYALKPRARNPLGVTIDELFPGGAARARGLARAPHQSRLHFGVFAALDRLSRLLEPLIPGAIRRRAIDAAVAFVTERRNGEDGLGAIFPAMANTVMMFDALGYARDHPHMAAARRAIDKLVVSSGDEAYCQPCVSPIWDTVLASLALLESGGDAPRACARRGLAWLEQRQVLDVVGDWALQRPHVRPGGWAFQYANPHYPDLDDTAVVVIAMDRFARTRRGRDEPDFGEAIARAREWVLGLQSRNGGWGAFDADNTSEYLNHIPFADHGALLDPPTADVTARCACMIAQLDPGLGGPALERALAYLKAEQEADGSWYGRWGMNYVYGTWSVLCALDAAGVDRQSAQVRRAVAWLTSRQNDDGGWGESGDSYALDGPPCTSAQSTASQTAWALLALVAAGEARGSAAARGVDWLLARQRADGFWPEPQYTATGFPRVFYLRYHGYARYFPLWALARYRNATRSRDGLARFGM